MPVWSKSYHWFGRKSADKKLCGRRRDPHQKQYAPPLPFGWGGHKLAFMDPVVSEKMLEECGRRQRRACLYDMLTNQYIKRSSHIIRSKICRNKLTYILTQTRNVRFTFVSVNCKRIQAFNSNVLLQ